jgi:RimJ/RimL family protein N-acetyltransferase
VELGYLFLPWSWGKGFATEAVRAVLEEYRKANSFWAPYKRVYVRAVVDSGNPESLRVLEKVGLEKRGTPEWEGERVWLAGRWRESRELVYGMYLV